MRGSAQRVNFQPRSLQQNTLYVTPSSRATMLKSGRGVAAANDHSTTPTKVGCILFRVSKNIAAACESLSTVQFLRACVSASRTCCQLHSSLHNLSMIYGEMQKACIKMLIHRSSKSSHIGLNIQQYSSTACSLEFDSKWAV